MSWKIKKLGEIASIIVGQSPKGENYNKKGNGLPFYQGKKNYGKKYLKEPNVWTNQITKMAIAGDILVSLRAPVGAINISTNDICIGRGLAAIRVSERVINDYLYYFLIMIQDEIKGSAGAIFNSLNKEQIKNILVPLPSLDEQRAIVGKLDAVFENIDNAVTLTQAKKEEVNSLKTSLLTNFLQQENDDRLYKRTGQIKKLKFELCIEKIKKPKRIQKKMYLAFGKHPIVSQENKLINGYCNDDKAVFKIDNPVVVFGEHNRNLKFIDFDFVVGADGIKIFKPIASIHPKYFYYQLILLMPKSIGYSRHYRLIKNLLITFPPLDEQRAIVDKLDTVFEKAEKLEAASIENEKNYSALKNALLRQMLSENNEVVA